MTRVDLHPDELLDPGRLHRLEPEEQARLDNHLAGCAACSFELAATQDFARAAEAGRPEEDPAAARVVERTVSALGSRGGAARPAVRRVGGMRWSRRLLLVAAILAVTAAAGAASWYFVLRPLLQRFATSRPTPATCIDAGARETDAVPEQVSPVPTPLPRRGPPALRPPPAPPVETAVPPPAPPRHPRDPEQVEPPPPVAPVAPGTPSEALLRANELRRGAQFAEAATLYRELQERFPGSREELLSRVTLGRLLLDRLGQPQRALAEFDAYLAAAPNGTLAEDALVGRAIALERLGRASDERLAWTDLLTRFPATAQAERARGRLVELGEALP